MEVEELAKKLKLRLFRTSVKEDFNVNEGQSNANWCTRVYTLAHIVFTYLSESYLEKQSQSDYTSKPSQSSIGMSAC